MKSNTYLREKENKNKISLTLLPTVVNIDKVSSILKCSVEYSFNNIHDIITTKFEYPRDEYFKSAEELQYLLPQYNFYEIVIPTIENKYKIKIDDSSDSLHVNDNELTGNLTLNYKKVA